MKIQFFTISVLAVFALACTPLNKATNDSASSLSSISLQNLPAGVSAEYSYLEIVSSALKYNKKYFIKDIQSNAGVKFEPGTYVFSTVLYDAQKKMIGQNIESNDQCKKQAFTLKPGANDIKLVVCRADGEPVFSNQSDIGITGIDIIDPVAPEVKNQQIEVLDRVALHAEMKEVAIDVKNNSNQKFLKLKEKYPEGKVVQAVLRPRSDGAVGTYHIIDSLYYNAQTFAVSQAYDGALGTTIFCRYNGSELLPTEQLKPNVDIPIEGVITSVSSNNNGVSIDLTCKIRK